jgi:DNA-binding NtrC family response regulator
MNQRRRGVVVVDPDENHSRGLCAVLERERYRTVSMNSLEGLQNSIDRERTLALFVNLDFLPLDNRMLRELRAGYRELCIIGVSSRSFHPELKEALSRYIDACFAKPLDLDALLYYLKSAQDRSLRVE